MTVAGLRPYAAISTSIYFDKKSPFSQTHFVLHNKSDADGAATPALVAGAATTPGDYKYGLRIEEDGDLVIDIDPRLIVD